jgi:hypothetical protein
MDPYLVAALFNLCINCAILLSLILVLYSAVYEGECAGIRWPAQCFCVYYTGIVSCIGCAVGFSVESRSKSLVTKDVIKYPKDHF